MAKRTTDFELWFLVGSQSLYGTEVLRNVESHSKKIAEHLDLNCNVGLNIKFHKVLTSDEEIRKTIQAANFEDKCIGLIFWMHTFSPAKMWINGLKILHKPYAQLHTQYNDKIPWTSINMDFMNENQTAHGGREFGHINVRLKKNPKIIVGHWKDEDTISEIEDWSRAVIGVQTLHETRVARLGDNMRSVAVTEGDKVEAQIKLGFTVDGFGIGDVIEYITAVEESSVKMLLDEYSSMYEMTPVTRKSNSLTEAARIELGLRWFLKDKNYQAFTTTFENLHGLHQLPGLAVQRLMNDGYGFGAEGDWKTAAMLRMVKVMEQGLTGGSSFMEDYTYHFDGENSKVLGAHMLEICPTITTDKPKCLVHPLSIGGKADPARLVFDADSGPAINLSLIDLGDRFRFLINEVDVVKPQNSLPNLPVASALWKPQPNLKVAAKCWIKAGGAHHTVFSKSISTSIIEDLAEIFNLELLTIDENTDLNAFTKEIRSNEIYYLSNH